MEKNLFVLKKTINFVAPSTPKVPLKGIGRRLTGCAGLPQVEIHICKKAFITRFVL